MIWYYSYRCSSNNQYIPKCKLHTMNMSEFKVPGPMRRRAIGERTIESVQRLNSISKSLVYCHEIRCNQNDVFIPQVLSCCLLWTRSINLIDKSNHQMHAFSLVCASGLSCMNQRIGALILFICQVRDRNGIILLHKWDDNCIELFSATMWHIQ